MFCTETVIPPAVCTIIDKRVLFVKKGKKDVFFVK